MSDYKSNHDGPNEMHAPDEFWCYFLGGVMVLCLGIFLFMALSKSASGPVHGEMQLLAADGYEEAANIAHGKTLYDNCAACHGNQAEGNQLYWAPALAHLQPWYVEGQYKKFKDGHRGKHPRDTAGLRMRPMGRILQTDKDIADVAAYIHTFKDTALPSQTLADKGDAAKGEAAYIVCQACHAPDGQGMEAMKSPSIAGLNDWYIVAQLSKFKEGIRGVDPADITGALMRPQSLLIPDEQAMIDLAVYITNLEPAEAVATPAAAPEPATEPAAEPAAAPPAG